MRARIQGLQLEADLLAADIELRQRGETREFAYAPNGSRIDITDLWLAHLRAKLAVKRSMLRKLRERYQALVGSGPQTPPTPAG